MVMMLVAVTNHQPSTRHGWAKTMLSRVLGKTIGNLTGRAFLQDASGDQSKNVSKTTGSIGAFQRTSRVGRIPIAFHFGHLYGRLSLSFGCFCTWLATKSIFALMAG